MRYGSLFSGIGGIDLGLDRAGMECQWQVEIDPFCRRVLEKHWPDVPKYGDIREVGENLERVDLIVGGFPCQPVSIAGKQRGQQDERWLWPEFARIVRILRPRYVFVENVPGILRLGFTDVQNDLAQCGYDTEWQSIPAAAVGAPHIRERVWIIAYADGGRAHTEQEYRPERKSTAHSSGNGEIRIMANSESSSLKRQSEGYEDARLGFAGSGEGQPRAAADRGLAYSHSQPLVWTAKPRRECHPWATEPAVGRLADGIPDRLARLRALGNAVVPQCAEYIGRLIMTHALRTCLSGDR